MATDPYILPVGSVLLWAGGGTLPGGWLACDGAAVSRTTWAALFAAAGTAFGAGDGTTTFNVPTLAGPASGVSYAVNGGPAGAGVVPVDHNTGGTDNLRYVVPGGASGVDGGTVRAYLTADYAAGAYAERGRSHTGPGGRWLTPMYLAGGSYTFAFSKPGTYATGTKEQAV